MSNEMRIFAASPWRSVVERALPDHIEYQLVADPCTSADIAIGTKDQLAEVNAEVRLVCETVDDAGRSSSEFSIPTDASPGSWRAMLHMAARIAELSRKTRETEREASILHDQAHTDALTGLANRRGWDAALEAFVEDASAACLILDIDDFKGCNDSHGHAFGDQVLQSVARTLRDNLRQLDQVARIGGDEFAALLPQLPDDRLADVVERIRQQVQQQMRAELGADAPNVSIGATSRRDEPIDEAVQRADEALFAAKQSGRNRTAIR